MSFQTPQLTQLVQAGAGAGKTTGLVEQVINVALWWHRKHGRWPRIVVTTFTRMATQELKERLLIRALEYNADNKKTSSSNGNGGAGEQLLDFITSPHQLHISTLHGVLALFLRRHGPQMGVDTNFKIISQQEELQMAKNIIYNMLTHKKIFNLEPEKQNNDDVVCSYDDFLSAYSTQEWTQILIDYYKAWLKDPHLRAATSADFARIVGQDVAQYTNKLEHILSRPHIFKNSTQNTESQETTLQETTLQEKKPQETTPQEKKPQEITTQEAWQDWFNGVQNAAKKIQDLSKKISAQEPNYSNPPLHNTIEKHTANQTQKSRGQNFELHESEYLKNLEQLHQALICFIQHLGLRSKKCPNGIPKQNKNNTNPQIKKAYMWKAEVKDYFAKNLQEVHQHFNPTLWPQFEQRAELVHKVGQKFTPLFLGNKLNAAKLSTDDLENLVIHQLNANPLLAHNFSREWDYWLVDEYQDTSPLQTQLLQYFMSAAKKSVAKKPTSLPARTYTSDDKTSTGLGLRNVSLSSNIYSPDDKAASPTKPNTPEHQTTQGLEKNKKNDHHAHFEVKKREGYFVGDPQQSIYLFRGSRPYVFKQKLFEVGHSHVHKKVHNYRSHPELVDFFNSFFDYIKLPNYTPAVAKKNKDDLDAVNFSLYGLKSCSKSNKQLLKTQNLSNQEDSMAGGQGPFNQKGSTVEGQDPFNQKGSMAEGQGPFNQKGSMVENEGSFNQNDPIIESKYNSSSSKNKRCDSDSITSTHISSNSSLKISLTNQKTQNNLKTQADEQVTESNNETHYYHIANKVHFFNLPPQSNNNQINNNQLNNSQLNNKLNNKKTSSEQKVFEENNEGGQAPQNQGNKTPLIHETIDAALMQSIKILNSRGVDFKDMAVLARNNNTLVQAASYLKQCGVPVSVQSSKSFSTRREVLDALSLLKFLAHPFDNKNLILLLRSPWVRVPDSVLTTWIEKLQNHKQIQNKTSNPIANQSPSNLSSIDVSHHKKKDGDTKNNKITESSQNFQNTSYASYWIWFCQQVDLGLSSQNVSKKSLEYSSLEGPVKAAKLQTVDAASADRSDDQATTQNPNIDQQAQQIAASNICGLLRAQKKVRDLGLAEGFKQSLVDLGFFDFCHEFDPTGRREANLWKLYTLLHQEHLKPGFNVIHFAKNLDPVLNSNIEENRGGDAQAAHGNECVQLMTIHKAKGLEFKHVFLLDAELKASRGSGQISIFCSNADQAPENITHFKQNSNIQQNKAHQSNLDSKSFDPMVDQQNNLPGISTLWSVSCPLNNEDAKTSSPLKKKLNKIYTEWEEQEYKRLLYVALTRAKQGLYFFWHREEKKAKNTKTEKLEKSFTWAQYFISYLEKNNCTFTKLSNYGCHSKSVLFLSPSQTSAYVDKNQNITSKNKITSGAPKHSSTLQNKNFISVSRFLSERLTDQNKSSTTPNPSIKTNSKLHTRSHLMNNHMQEFNMDALLKTVQSQARGTDIHAALEHLVYRCQDRATFLNEDQLANMFEKLLQNNFIDCVGRSTLEDSTSHNKSQLLNSQNEMPRIARLTNDEALNNKNIKKLKQNFKNLLGQKNIPWIQILHRGHPEWGFCLKTKDGFLDGQIDLWAELGDKIWLIDYKTGRPEKEKKQEAFKQLNIYSLAVRAHLKQQHNDSTNTYKTVSANNKSQDAPSKKPIYLAAVYIDAGQIEIQPALPNTDLKNQYNL